MIRMLNAARFAIAQSMAEMTSLAVPAAVGVEHLQVDEVRAGRHARVAGRDRAGSPAACRR